MHKTRLGQRPKDCPKMKIFSTLGLQSLARCLKFFAIEGMPAEMATKRRAIGVPEVTNQASLAHQALCNSTLSLNAESSTSQKQSRKEKASSQGRG